MLESSDKISILTTKVCVPPVLKDAFIDWQTNLNAVIAGFPGFVSLEILSPHEMTQQLWIVVERFSNPEHLANWQKSNVHQRLLTELKSLLKNDSSIHIQKIDSKTNENKAVTEVLVAQVAPGMEDAYHQWIAKIHQMEAKSPGFRGVYVESPKNEGGNWITLLQFDNIENLDRWLNSPERSKMLQESQSLFNSLENHRVTSPYASWFASLDKKGKKGEIGAVPPVWKQTMLILLALFPVVMLELKYLAPMTASLNNSLANFIGNAISVTLLAWPLVPLTIKGLHWWLSPSKDEFKITILGTLCVLFLYLLEIVLFWNFL